MLERWREWWQGRNARERALIALGGAMLAVAVFWAYVWAPLETDRVRLVAAMPTLRAQAQQVALQAADVARLRAAARARGDVTPSQPAIEQALKDAGVGAGVTGVALLGGGRVQVNLGVVPFDALVRAIAQLAESHGLVVGDDRVETGRRARERSSGNAGAAGATKLMGRGKARPGSARLRWWHAALFVAAFAITVVAALPARWAAAAAAYATDGHVRVVAASGSPWAGRGDLVLRVDRGEVVLKGASWRWLPARIFAGELAFKVRFDGTATGDVVIVRRASGLALRDAEVRLPVAAIAEGVGPLRGWSPGGTLVFRTQKLDLGPRGAAGDAELVWENASTAGVAARGLPLPPAGGARRGGAGDRRNAARPPAVECRRRSGRRRRAAAARHRELRAGPSRSARSAAPRARPRSGRRRGRLRDRRLAAGARVNLVRARRAIEPLVEAVPTLAVLALLVLAGWLAARWLLYFAAAVEAPAVGGLERVQLGAAAQALSDAHLFGTAPVGARGEAVSNLNIKLKGVLAGGVDAPAVAIVNTGDRDETARVGGEIVPGVVLDAVHPRHVVLRRNGVLERVNLQEPQIVAVAPPPRAPPRRAQTSAVPVAAPAPAPGAVTAPGALAAPAAPGGAPQGLVIQSVPPGSLLERFGLMPGDVVRSVNGEVVTSEADVARILQSRGLQGPFTAEVQRGDVTVPISVNAQR